MYYSTTIAYTTPVYGEAYIAKGKNRLKQIGQQVYLADQEEFAIELFNPKSNSVLAKIKINGINRYIILYLEYFELADLNVFPEFGDILID